MLDLITILKEVPLFCDIPNHDIEKLFVNDKYTIKNYKKNAVIYFPNEVCNTADIVLDGIVSIQGLDDKGNYISISDFFIGDMLGGNLLFSKANFYPMIILSKTNVTLLHLQKDLILKLCQEKTCFLTNFLHLVSDKSLILANKIKSLSFKSIRENIIEFLIHESHVQKSDTIILNITKKELAERIGAQRSSLSRELNKMKKDGLVTYDASSITICNMDLLLKHL